MIEKLKEEIFYPDWFDSNYQLQSELLEDDWGTLILLDACRFDYFENEIKKVGIDGNLLQADSQVNATAKWYCKYCTGKPGSTDIIAIVANPWGLRYRFKFEKVIRAWPGGADCNQVNPDRTMKYYRRYAKGKRSMIHFIPPHQPFINPLGLQLYKDMGFDISEYGTNWDDRKNFDAANNAERQLAAYGREGHWDEIKAAYAGAVNNILQKIKSWLPEFLPPVIITSDHGELVGEGGPGGEGSYGHCHDQPDVIMFQRLVPWFEVHDDMEIKRRLEALGYE